MYKSLVYRHLVCGLVTCIVIFAITSCARHREAKVQMRRDHIIIDRLERAEGYYHLHPAFERAFAFLRQNALADLPIGRHEIDNDRMFCIISKGPGRSRVEAKLEAHRKYIDIQYVIAGKDEMGWRPTAACTLSDVSYDADKDIEFFRDAGAGRLICHFLPGGRSRPSSR